MGTPPPPASTPSVTTGACLCSDHASKHTREKKRMTIHTRKKNKRWGGKAIGNTLAVYTTKTFEREAVSEGDLFIPQIKGSSEI